MQYCYDKKQAQKSIHSRYEHVGTKTFPCYYSRAFNELVVARYSWEENLKHMILSIIIPNVLFAISIGVLSYWYCPCKSSCHKDPRVYAEFPSAKEKWVILNFFYAHRQPPTPPPQNTHLSFIVYTHFHHFCCRIFLFDNRSRKKNYLICTLI